MIAAIPRVRRFLAAFLAIAAASGLFRVQLASALVTRGDDILQGSDAARAGLFYERALRFDPSSRVAAERITFASVLTKTKAALAHGLDVADRGLQAHPDDNNLRNDRALILQQLRRNREAREDFLILAKRTGDVRYYEFAAQCAKRSGDLSGARSLFARVVALDPRFGVARRELERLGTQR